MDDRIDFLPKYIKICRARRQSFKRQTWLAIVAAVGLAVLGYVRQSMATQAKAELTWLDRRISAVNRQLSLRTDLEQQLADLMIKKRIDDTLGSRANALEVLAELERTLPESIVLTSLTLEAVEIHTPIKSGGSGAPVVAGAQAPPKETVSKRVRLVFTGLAPSDVEVANFIAQMSAGRLFEDVSMGYVRNVDFRGRNVREFQASCHVAR
ncbi:MAG: PilN domain-containing protein [Phycisphaerae bacterium]|nr:PilN domain-containing protein [Phycisphaerae bacterium]